MEGEITDQQLSVMEACFNQGLSEASSLNDRQLSDAIRGFMNELGNLEDRAHHSNPFSKAVWEEVMGKQRFKIQGYMAERDRRRALRKAQKGDELSGE